MRGNILPGRAPTGGAWHLLPGDWMHIAPRALILFERKRKERPIPQGSRAGWLCDFPQARERTRATSCVNFEGSPLDADADLHNIAQEICHDG